MHTILNCRQTNLDIVTLDNSNKIKEFQKIFDAKNSETDWLLELSNFCQNTLIHDKTTPISLILPELYVTNINLKITKNDLAKFSEAQTIHRQLSKKFNINTEQFIYKFKKIFETATTTHYIICLINKKLITSLNKIFAKFNVDLIPPTIAHTFFAKSLLINNQEAGSLFIFLDDNITRLLLLNNNILGIRQFNSIEIKKINPNTTTPEIHDLAKEINITTHYFIHNITAKIEITNVIICSNNKGINMSSALLSLGNNITINNLTLNEEPISTNNCNKASILGTINILNHKNIPNIIFTLNKNKPKLSRKILIPILLNAILLPYLLLLFKNNQILQSDIITLQKITEQRNAISKTIETNTTLLKNLQQLQKAKSFIPNRLTELKQCLNKISPNLYLDILSITQETLSMRHLVGLQTSSKDCTNGSVMLKVRGRIISASSSVQNLKEHLNVCFSNLLNSTVNCMKVELKSKKNSSSTKDFVCSLMSDPESYM